MLRNEFWLSPRQCEYKYLWTLNIRLNIIAHTAFVEGVGKESGE
jgi:hypothetical protein